mmetsp:Transcript_23556/g.27026  ORF Transcript_23556/g.27026 Transcript_23556/m.27026 type:complete len:145 (+) Transcript_23556:45-479(+)
MATANQARTHPTVMKALEESWRRASLSRTSKSSSSPIASLRNSVFVAENTEFVKFKFLNTLPYIDKDYYYSKRNLVALHADGTLGVYSLNTGKLLQKFDLDTEVKKLNQTNFEPSEISWSHDVLDFSAGNEEGQPDGNILKISI